MRRDFDAVVTRQNFRLRCALGHAVALHCFNESL
jgi:hypothetical protein